MCFQYKRSTSRKEKIRGKGQTKQIKFASVPDFNINYHGFGRDSSISSSKFFYQGRRKNLPRRREIMTGLKIPKGSKNSGLLMEGAARSSRPRTSTNLQFLLLKPLEERLPDRHVFPLQGTHWEDKFHQPHQAGISNA